MIIATVKKTATLPASTPCARESVHIRTRQWSEDADHHPSGGARCGGVDTVRERHQWHPSATERLNRFQSCATCSGPAGPL